MTRIIRLGFTETTLLFYHYLKKTNKPQNIIDRIIKSENDLINWLYTTSGFYDKSINGNNFNFNALECKVTEPYNQFMDQLLEIIENSQLILCFHEFDTEIQKYKIEFLNYVISKGSTFFHLNGDTFFNFINGKKVLIVNPISELMIQQYHSGNVRKIYAKFPPLNEIHSYKNPYTFFNNGPDAHILLSSEKICTDILSQNAEEDVAMEDAPLPGLEFGWAGRQAAHRHPGRRPIVEKQLLRADLRRTEAIDAAADVLPLLDGNGAEPSSTAPLPTISSGCLAVPPSRSPLRLMLSR